MLFLWDFSFDWKNKSKWKFLFVYKIQIINNNMTDDKKLREEIERFQAKRRRVVRKVLLFINHDYLSFRFIGTVRFWWWIQIRRW